jgi:hypothetical protein
MRDDRPQHEHHRKRDQSASEPRSRSSAVNDHAALLMQELSRVASATRL